MPEDEKRDKLHGQESENNPPLKPEEDREPAPVPAPAVGEAPATTNERKPSRKSRKEVEDLEKKISDLESRNDALRAEAADLKDKWLRAAAEFENFRKRTRREWELLQQRTKSEVILEMLSVADDFERAFRAIGDRDDEVVQGIRLIYNNLRLSLERLGVIRMEALNAPFDPAYHQAIAQIERDGAKSNEIIEVVQDGYLLGDLVVRPAKVVIAK